MNYRTLYVLSIIVTIVGAVVGAAVMSSAPLELTRQQVAILGLVMIGLTTAQGFLPRITKPPSDDRTDLD